MIFIIIIILNITCKYSKDMMNTIMEMAVSH